MKCAKLKIKIFVYFVTSVCSFISNIVLTNLQHENENKQMDIDLQEMKIKKVGQSVFVTSLLLFIIRHYKWQYF